MVDSLDNRGGQSRGGASRSIPDHRESHAGVETSGVAGLCPALAASGESARGENSRGLVSAGSRAIMRGTGFELPDRTHLLRVAGGSAGGPSAGGSASGAIRSRIAELNRRPMGDATMSKKRPDDHDGSDRVPPVGDRHDSRDSEHADEPQHDDEFLDEEEFEDEDEGEDEDEYGLDPKLSAAVDSGEARIVASNSYDDYGMGGGGGFSAIYKWKRTYYAHIPESGTEKYRSFKEAFECSGVCGIGGLNQSISVDMKFDDLLAHYRKECARNLPNYDPKHVFQLNGVHCAIREGGSILVFEEFFQGDAVPTTGGSPEPTIERIARRPDGRFCILIESEGEIGYYAFEDLSEGRLEGYLKKRANGDADALERRRDGLKRAMEAI
jgi:hypothetical protein